VFDLLILEIIWQMFAFIW